MDDLLANWAIGPIRRIEPVSSYSGNVSLVTTADHGCFMVKKKSGPAAAEQESKILSELSRIGAPVAVPIRTVDGAWYASSGGETFCLSPRIPGETVKEHFAGDAAARARMFGQAIAFLHHCMTQCDSPTSYREMRLTEQIREWAVPRIREYKAVVDADSAERIWRQVGPELDSVYDELPKQLIHRDLHPGNMLFDSDKLTGLVDFEMVVRGPRIFDVCYCGTSLLVSAFPDTEKMGRWPTLFRSLVAGYDERSPLTLYELKALPGVLASIELLFAAFSLETRAEEAAQCNISVLHWLAACPELGAKKGPVSWETGL